MICISPANRIKSDVLVQDSWINSAHLRYRQLSKSIVNSAFQNMRSFRCGFELQRAALMWMAPNQISEDEKENLRMIFDALDEEKDGEIELEEFLIQLKDKFDISVKKNEME